VRRAAWGVAGVAALAIVVAVVLAAGGDDDDAGGGGTKRAAATVGTTAGGGTSAAASTGAGGAPGGPGAASSGSTASSGAPAGGSSGGGSATAAGAGASGASGGATTTGRARAQRKPLSKMTPKERAQLVLQNAVDRQKTPSPVNEEQSTEPAVNSPSASALPGILRPCDDARDFTVYTLGERFEGRYAWRLGSYCQKPPQVVDGKVAVPTRQNDTEVFYGPCRGGDALGCGYDVSVRSMPSCERPYSLYTAFTGPPGQEADAPRLITLRGVPAAEFEDRIELWTKDTAIVVFARPDRARAAVAALRPAGQFDASAGASLPAPAEDIVDPKLTTVHCAS
jgi:hypothetical protein